MKSTNDVWFSSRGSLFIVWVDFWSLSVTGLVVDHAWGEGEGVVGDINTTQVGEYRDVQQFVDQNWLKIKALWIIRFLNFPSVCSSKKRPFSVPKCVEDIYYLCVACSLTRGRKVDKKPTDSMTIRHEDPDEFFRKSGCKLMKGMGWTSGWEKNDSGVNPNQHEPWRKKTSNV